jgi:pilus assembly protein CpaC
MTTQHPFSKPLLFLFLAVMALTQAAFAQAPSTPKQISLTVGEGELVPFTQDISKVVVAEPKIADAIVVSPREVMVTAKGIGKTTLVIWEDGKAPQRYNIHVLADETAVEDFNKAVAKELKGELPDEGIVFNGNSEVITLTGNAKTAEAAKRAEGIASTRARKVINLIKLPQKEDPRQIMLQVKFAAVDRSSLSELGFNYFSRNNKTLGGLSTQQYQQPRFSQFQFQDQEFSNSGLNIADALNLFLFRPDLNIGATIRALASRNLLQILAEPNLIAVEGREASFVAGGEFPFPTLNATSTGGAIAPVVTVQFRPFGVQLLFTPTVMESGSIHLKVRPEVSALDFTNSVTVQGVLIPALSTRRAETEVILKDGESFAIAGLIDNRVIQTLSRVRGLGDIPILGQLFRSRSTRKSSDELVVVITPRFVRPLTAEEKAAQIPSPLEAFMMSTKEEKTLLDSKKKGKKKDKGDASKPQYVGPSGYQDPAKKPQ